MTGPDARDAPLSPLAALETLSSAGHDGGALFAGLDADARAAVEAETTWTSLQSGSVLFHEGDAADSLYVLVTGRLRVSVHTPSGEDEVAELGRGEVVGEMALLTGSPRSATVTAIRDSRLIRLSRSAFERIVERCPRVMLLVTRRLVQRLQRTTRAPRTKSTLTTIAVVSLAASIDAAAFGADLVTALGSSEAVLVTRGMAEAEAGREGAAPGDDRLTVWLDGLERRHRHVVYAGDPRDTAWTDRAMREADCILFVAPGARQADADAEAIAARATAVPAARELVLLHPPPYADPRGTARWIDTTRARAHYHVREGMAADVARVARMLTGRAVGLALGGGGARGFAHIGVIEALTAAGVPIDAIAGTSMGAVLAAQYAAGLNAAAMRELNRQHWVRQNPLKDKTLPVVALLAGRRLERMIDRMFGDTQIEDLWTSFFCISADLTRAEMRVHTRGALGRAVRASMSLPGIAIPVHDAGSLLVDGGLMNNVPADVMRTVCGKVVAVDVSPQKDLAITAPYPAAASGWRLLWGRKASNLPGIGAILMRSVMLSSTRHQTAIAHDVDLFLRPAVDHFGMFEWDAIDRLADAGRASARDALAALSVPLT